MIEPSHRTRLSNLGSSVDASARAEALSGAAGPPLLYDGRQKFPQPWRRCEMELSMTTTQVDSDLDILRELNRDYIDAVQNADVQRFDVILAEDFLCSNPDGSLVDKAQFLQQTTAPVRISGLKAHDVQVRILGDFAIIHGRTTFTGGDGQPGRGRYTDTWARRDGRWVATSAHVTRL